MLCVSILPALVTASCSLLPGSLQTGMNGNAPEQQAQELLVPVVRGSISSALSYVGNLKYNQSADLTWKTKGVVEKVYVKLGDQVKKGDTLAVLATDSLDSSVILAEKTMIEQQEKLEDVLDSASDKMQAYVNLNDKERALIQAKLEQEALYYPRATREEMELAWDKYALANLNFNYAKQDYDYLVSKNEPFEGYEEGRIIRFGRMKFKIGEDSRSGRERKFEDYVNTYNELVKAYETYVWTSGKPSATDYAVAEGNVEVAQMEYDKALEEYLSYENLPREKDVHAVEVSLNTAEMLFNRRFIKAQFDGIVTSLNAVEGSYVTRGTNALHLDDKSRIFIPFSIPELDVSIVKTGSEVDVTLDALNGKTFKGRIFTISDASIESGNTSAFNALVEIEDPDERMLAGMTAEVSMKVNEKKNVLLIPNTALNYQDGKTFVTVQNGTERQIVEIQLGLVSGDISEVVSGNLKEGEKLVVKDVSPAVLTLLGLDPKNIYPETGQNPENFPAVNSGQKPTVSDPGEMRSDRLQPEDAPVTEIPSKKPVPVITPAVTQTAVEDENDVSDQTGSPEALQQFPKMEDGQFPQRPERIPNGDETEPFHGPREGQRPDGSREFQEPANGKRPEGSENRNGRPPAEDFPPAGESDEIADEKG